MIGVGLKRGRGPNHPPEFKRQLAAAALRPDASVSQIVLAHGINTNMLFRWCRQYREGRLGLTPALPAEMLPVWVVGDATGAAPQTASQPDTLTPNVRTSGTIEIRFATATVRIDGAADAATIDAVLRGLRS